MKRMILNATPLILFVASALLAYSRASSENQTATGENFHAQSSRKLTSVPADSADLTTVLRNMESRILPHNPPPPTKTYSAREMDEHVSYRSFPVDSYGIQYASEWARDSPEEMFAWLVDKNEKMNFQAYLLFQEWAPVDHDAALAAAIQIPNEKLRAQALLTTLEILCTTKPERAQKILLENADLFAATNHSWVTFQSQLIEETWELFLALPEGKVRTQLQAKLLGSTADQKALNLWNQASDAQRQEWLDAGFTPSWGAGYSFAGLQDLMRAAAETTGNPMDAAKFIENHGTSWAERDLVAAVEWAQAHVKGKKKIESIEKLFNISAQKDFENTLRVWQQIPEGFLKKEIAEAILRATPEDRKAEAKAVLKME